MRDHFTFLILMYGRSVFVIIVGTLLLSFGVAAFSIPYRLVAGGTTGLAIILESALPFGFLTAEVYASLLTWLFFALGWIFLGSSFSIKTLISTAVYPLGISIFSSFSPTLYSTPSPSFLIMAAIAGGLLVGTGCAVIFRSGGSSGGTDVIALIVCRYFPRLSSARAIFMLDALTVLLGVLVIRSLLLSLLGILHALVCAWVIEVLYVKGEA